MPSDKDTGWLCGITVVEIGGRIAAGACGSLLAQTGATVIFVEPPDPARDNTGKWPQRALYAAGKKSLCIDPANTDDTETLVRLIGKSDVVLLSSDLDGPYAPEAIDAWTGKTIVVDFTAFGQTGPLAGEAYSEAMVQAVSGAAHTTGLADGPPVIMKVPAIENATAMYGAAACAAALISRDQCGAVQHVDMALYDCAINCLATFLPAYFGGGNPGRLGNRHSMCSPWNAYAARDGWILICSASDHSWRLICNAMDFPELIADRRFVTLADRLENRDDIDAAIQAWVSQYSLTDCIEKLLAAGVACGPIVRVDTNETDINLAHRAMIRHLHDPVSGHSIRVPGSIFRSDTAPGIAAAHIPAPDADRAFVQALPQPTSPQANSTHSKLPPEPPLAGIRVLEIGQYTTAPLSSRHLATLGAEVLKIEPPDGDAARQWQPSNDGQSYFFVMSNSDKESFAVDLDDPEDAATFTNLVASADILVENLKPGSLARRGFGRAELAEINPGLVYCAISGFGTDSAYGERPAFDTVIQAMSGVMDANALDGMPLKAGISVGDVMGGKAGLFALLAALRRRGRSGKGEFIDLSMQDVAAWTTAPLWNAPAVDGIAQTSMIRCKDGYVLVSGKAQISTTELTRAEMSAELKAQGAPCTPVLSIAETAEFPQTKARELIVWRRSETGVDWPLLGSPLRLSRTPPLIAKPIGPARRIDTQTKAALGLK
jgi:crotonobetainyl-CoA:carnitine CoA-transferase CaiB-like acyl-CoA transferase